MKEKLKINIYLESALKTKFSSFKKRNSVEPEYEYYSSLIL
jgi:hypothetical protein